MNNLDEKVFGRDSIFIDDQGGQGLGFFKKLKRRIKKVKSLASRVMIPKVVRRAASKFESKNRKDLKRVGAVAAVATGAWLAGPAILAAVGGKAGGAAIAKGAATAVGKQALGMAVSQQVAKKMNKYEERAFKAELEAMTPVQVLADDRVRDIGIGVAQRMQKGGVRKMLASEGAFEVGYQAEKSNMKRNIMIGGGLVAFFGVSLLSLRGGRK